MNKFRELAEEFRTVFSGRGKLADSVVPPIVFVIVNAVMGFDAAMWSALILAVLITGMRLIRKQPPAYALGGLGGVIIAILIARVLDRAEGYFLPSIVTGALTIVLCAVSIVVKRPLVAWTSYITRRWPLAWYWHPRIRPAYTRGDDRLDDFLCRQAGTSISVLPGRTGRRIGDCQRADGVACDGYPFGSELPVWTVATAEFTRSKCCRI